MSERNPYTGLYDAGTGITSNPYAPMEIDQLRMQLRSLQQYAAAKDAEIETLKAMVSMHAKEITSLETQAGTAYYALKERDAEIAELNETVTTLKRELHDSPVVNERLEAEIAALRTDAERYRWIRQRGAWETEAFLNGLSPEQYDAAIDAAMADTPSTPATP